MAQGRVEITEAGYDVRHHILPSLLVCIARERERVTYLAGSPAAPSFMIVVVPFRCLRAFRAKYSTFSTETFERDLDGAKAGEEAYTENEDMSYSRMASYSHEMIRGRWREEVDGFC